MTPVASILAECQLDDHARWAGRIEAICADQVRRAIADDSGRYTLDKLAALVSPAAEPFLEEMAAIASRLTTRRFGRTIQLYAPLYVSNGCINSCRYCGFNRTHHGERTRLSIDQAIADADILAAEGFRNILLVSGEDPSFVTVEYLCDLAARLRPRFSTITAEIYPLSQEQYAAIARAGIDGVTLYQESYDRPSYARWHPAGPKSDYDARLDAPDRFASAAMRRMGLGVLLGLADWRIETLAMAEHASSLIKRFWQSQVSFSFPRIRPAPEVAEQYDHLVADASLVQMMLALRLCFADAGLVLSTRESPCFRDAMARICVTSMSAGSRTNPGGYSGRADSTEQFAVCDVRTPAQVAAMIRTAGREPVWKDWDAAFTAPATTTAADV
jgi:2-iminoacetate synthase